MSSYTKMTEKQAQDILNLYSLPSVKGEKVVQLQPLSLGISNSNYKVITERSELLLKISNDKGPMALAKEQGILIKLNELGYAYSITPYLTKSGHTVYSYGEWYGVVYPFVFGVAPVPTPQSCFEIGKGLAHLHQLASKTHGQELRSHEDVGFGPKQIQDYVQSPLCPEDFKEAFLSFFPDKAEALMNAPLEKGLIHGDLYYDNTLFNQNQLVAVLDFEQSGIGELILDLGISISGTCLKEGALSLPLIKDYLKGYESVRSLPLIEKKFLGDSILLGFLSISLWRIKRFKEGKLNPLMKESYKELLIKAQQFKQTEVKT